jgi:hypothetical protein
MLINIELKRPCATEQMRDYIVNIYIFLIKIKNILYKYICLFIFYFIKCYRFVSHCVFYVND